MNKIPTLLHYIDEFVAFQLHCNVTLYSNHWHKILIGIELLTDLSFYLCAQAIRIN